MIKAEHLHSLSSGYSLKKFSGVSSSSSLAIYSVPDVLYWTRASLVNSGSPLLNNGFPVVDNQYVPIEAICHPCHLEDGHIRAFEEWRSSGANLPRIDIEAFVIGNIYSFVFYHWLEELLKVSVMESMGFTGCYVFPANYPLFCFQSLAILGVSPDRIHHLDMPAIISKTVFLESIDLLHSANHSGLVRNFRGLIHECCESKAEDASNRIKIWSLWGVSATDASRVIVNEEEVNSVIERHGLLKIDYGGLDFCEQIRLDRKCGLLAGLHGSNMAHCIFMEDRSSVIEVFPPSYVNPCLLQVARVFGHRYQQLVSSNHVNGFYSDRPRSKAVYIDIDHLELALTNSESWKNC